MHNFFSLLKVFRQVVFIAISFSQKMNVLIFLHYIVQKLADEPLLSYFPLSEAFLFTYIESPKATQMSR